MLFKNIIAYTLTDNKSIPTEYEEWNKLLSENKFVPCEPTEKTRVGWLKYDDNYFYWSDSFVLLTMKKEDKILPAEVIKSEVEERIENLEEKEGRKLKKTEKAAIKDDVINTLLPRAFSKYSTTSLVIDLQNKLIYVNTGSLNSAEDILALLRKNLGSLPVVPLQFQKDLSIEMKDFLLGKAVLNDHFELLDEFEISDGEGTINCKKTMYESEEIQNLLSTDKVVTKLALNYKENFSFLLTDGALIKRIKTDPLFKEEMEKEKDVNMDDKVKFDSDFILSVKTISNFIKLLKQQFDNE